MLNIDYSLIFGAITIVAAYIGIQGVNKFVAKSGRQSIIPIILTSILIFALISLPLNYLLKMRSESANGGEVSAKFRLTYPGIVSEE